MRKQEKVRLEKMKELRRKVHAYRSILKLTKNSVYGVFGNSSKLNSEAGISQYQSELHKRSSLIINYDILHCFPEVKKEDIIYQDSDSIFVKKKFKKMEHLTIEDFEKAYGIKKDN
jgi:hypothetical protein